MVYCRKCGLVLGTGNVKGGTISGAEFQPNVVLESDQEGMVAFHDYDQLRENERLEKIPIPQRESGDDAAVRLTSITGLPETTIRSLLLIG